MQSYYWFIVFIAVNGFLLLLLAINVSILRIKYRIAWGHGDNKHLMKAIRVHSNGTEQVPIYSLIILCLSFAAASSYVLSSLVISFTASRLVHAYGILFGKPILRKLGAITTYLSHAIAIVILLICLLS